MSWLHVIVFQFHDLLVHLDERSTLSNLTLHFVVWLVTLKFVWDFVEVIDSCCLDVLDLSVGHGSDQSVFDVFIGLPNFLKVFPHLR